jgi:hypothetical protein
LKITRNIQGVKGPIEGIYIDSKQYPYYQGQKVGYQMRKKFRVYDKGSKESLKESFCSLGHPSKQG